MKGLLCSLMVIWFALSTWWYVCNIKELCPEDQSSNVYKVTEENAKLVVHDGEFKVEAKDNIRFEPSNHLPSISASVKGVFLKIKEYLNNHPKKNIEVIGKFEYDEENNTISKDLGFARAEYIKDEMIAIGMDRKRIATSSRSVSKLRERNGFYEDAYAIIFSKKNLQDQKSPRVESEMDDIENRLKSKSRYFYFDTVDTDLVVDDELRYYLNELKIYLDFNPSKNVYLASYTDNAGEVEANMKLGKERVSTLKNIFRNAGINVSQIQTRSKGQSEPLVSNDAGQGMAKNRRVEVSLK